MGLVNSATDRDGKKYTISTAKKLDSWETAVFEGGSFSVMLGRNIRYVEVVLGDQPGLAQLVHNQVVTMVERISPAAWAMSALDVRQEQSRAATYVTARFKVDDSVGSRSRRILESALSESGFGHILAFAHELALLNASQWQRILRTAELDHDWMNPEHHAVAGPFVESTPIGPVAAAVVALYAGSAIARSGLSMDANQMLVFVCGTAAMALAARDILPAPSFEAMYRPFDGVILAPQAEARKS